MPRLSPEDAELVLKRMVGAAMVTLESIDCPIVLTDAQFDAVKEALPVAIAPVIEEHVGVQYE